MSQGAGFIDIVKARGFEAIRLAKEAGLTAPTIRHLMAAKTLPNLATTIKLARALNLPVGVLAQVFADQYQRRDAA